MDLKVKNPKKEHKNHSDKTKYDVVKSYILLNNSVTLAANTNGVPVPTVKSWRNSKWWDKLEAELRSQENLTLSPRLQKIIEKTIVLIEDRLENGDFMYDPRTGQMIRKPVALKEVNQVFKDHFDIKASIENAPKQQEEKETIQETLASLAKNFEELAKKQKERAPISVTDVVFIKED